MQSIASTNRLGESSSSLPIQAKMYMFGSIFQMEAVVPEIGRREDRQNGR
jgi:hypothetical protein